MLDIHRDVGHAHDSAQGAVRSVSCQLKSSLVDAGGKRAIAAEVSDETPAPKRHWPAAVTPSVSSVRLSLSTPLPPDSINTRDWGGVVGPSNSGAMLINQCDSIVPHHSAHRSSVLQRKPKVGVGCPRDISKTTFDYDEHENELRNRVLAGVIRDDDVELIDDGNDDGVRDNGNDDGVRDDASAVSNDAESVCANITSSDAVRLEDSDGEDDKQDVFISQEERDRRLELSMRKLGNMSWKSLHKYATTDLFVRGQLLLGSVAKARKVSRAKRERKCELVYQSLSFFGSQMEQRRQGFDRCMLCSSDAMFVYQMPTWKRDF